MSDPIVITREIVKRGWTDFEPKIITGLLTGGAATFLTGLLGQYGIVLDPTSQKLVVVALYFVGAYLTPSTGQTFTRTISKDLNGLVQSVEQHTGNTVSTVTGATPVQAPAPAAPLGNSVYADSNRGGTAPVTNPGQDSVTAILNGSPVTPEPVSDPAAPTQVLPGRAGAFLSTLDSHRLTGD
jgi:hypothetical protein